MGFNGCLFVWYSRDDLARCSIYPLLCSYQVCWLTSVASFCFFPIFMWSVVLPVFFSVFGLCFFPFLCLMLLFGIGCAVDRRLEMFFHVRSLIKDSCL